jgi:hypothetical protein
VGSRVAILGFVLAGTGVGCTGAISGDARDGEATTPADDGGTQDSPDDVPAVDAATPVARFCDALPAVPADGALMAPFVTFQDESSGPCLLTTGSSNGGTTCGANTLSAAIEVGCPWTSVSIEAYETPLAPSRFLLIQSAYVLMIIDGHNREGRVLELTIDKMDGVAMSGHYRVEFPANASLAAIEAQGTFSMCATFRVPVDPCRQYDGP